MIITAIKVSTIGQDIGMLYASKVAITSITSYVVIRSGTQALCSTAGSFLSSIPATAGSPVLIAASATSIIAYGLFIDFPRARTGAVLDEANRRCHRKKYAEANDLLKIAEKWFAVWSDRPIIQQYSGCITFLERSPKIGNNEDHKRWLEKELLHVDKTIKVLEKSEYYSGAKDDLRYHEVVAYLNTKQADQAKKILNSIDVNSAVHGYTVLFVIEKAEEIASKDPSKVDAYLNEVKPIFKIPEYLEIVTKYQEYFACQREFPILPEDKTGENVLKRSQIISSLITLIKPRKILRQLEESLLFDALLLHVHAKDFKKAENLLNQISSAAHEQLAIVLIEQAIECSVKNEFDKALDYLDRGIPLNGLASQRLLKAFKTYIELQKDQPLLTENSSPDQINKRISALDVILQNGGKINISPFIQKEKLLFYVQVKQFQEAADWVTKQSIGADVQDAAIFKIIQKAQQLSGQEALIYLTHAHDTLSRFENRDILKKIQNCLPNDPEKFASDEAEISWAVAADDLIAKISALKSLKSLHLFMKGFRCLLHIHRKEYAASSAIFQEMKLPEAFHAEAIMLIIKNSDKLGKEKGDVQELNYLRTACDSLHNLDHKEILIFYRDMLASRKDRSASSEKEDQWLAAQIALIDKVKPIEALSLLYSSLEDSTAIWYIQKQKYKQALEKLMVCSSTISAEITLQIIHRAGQLPPQEARLYLEDAYENLDGFKYREILQLYKDCLPQNDPEKNFPEEDARWVKAANAFIAAVKPLPDLSNLLLMMKGSKCMFHVAQKEYIAAASILGEGLLTNEFQAKVLNFILNEAHELSRKDQDLEASIYLEKAHKGMEEFSYRDILLKSQNYLASKRDCLSPESIVKWVDASETLILSLQPIPQMLNVILQVRCRQFEVFLSHNKFYDIKHVLEQAEIPPVLREKLQMHLIGHLVSHFLKLEEFDQISLLLDISEHRLAEKYRVFCTSLEQHLSDPTSVSKIQKSIQQLNALSNSLKTFDLTLPNWIISLQADLHYSAGELYWQMGDFRSSMEEFSRAQPLLAIQNLPETQRKLAYINILKEQALVLMTRV
jgi:hypothetical protein